MKVTDLQGAELDYWVAKAEGWKSSHPYTSDWAAGGPIIEREKIALNIHLDGTEWFAWIPMPHINGKVLPKAYNGPTPLVAAMRAYVAKKLGEEV